MAKLKDYGWWPTDWLSGADKPPHSAAVSARGAFATCTHSEAGLMVEGVCAENTKFSAIIPHSAGVDLKQLEKILDGCKGMRMSAVENLNLNLRMLPARNDSPVSHRRVPINQRDQYRAAPVFGLVLAVILSLPAICFGLRHVTGAVDKA